MIRRALAVALLLAVAPAVAPAAQAAVKCAPATAKPHDALVLKQPTKQLAASYHTFDLPPGYTIRGHITAGLDVLKAVAAKGTTTGATDGPPARALAVISVTVSEGTP